MRPAGAYARAPTPTVVPSTSLSLSPSPPSSSVSSLPIVSSFFYFLRHRSLLFHNPIAAVGAPLDLLCQHCFMFLLYVELCICMHHMPQMEEVFVSLSNGEVRQWFRNKHRVDGSSCFIS
ncbi:uncharacterized protein LOC131628549 [Vicia villosa]|uniref:uncharacterized protein LOC131628549 n=1 Tax=Vicia villosa TaxID=3911 RepID=UPI00273B1A8A|nr:uncharacterized protein LOC131628549 [Vicia villosa]